MPSDSTPFADLRVNKRSGAILSYELTERVHLNKLTILTKNRLLRTLDSSICEHWDGQQKRVLEFLSIAYGVRYMTRTRKGQLQVKMPRVHGDDVAGFKSDVEARLALAVSNNKNQWGLAPIKTLQDFGNMNHVHLSMWFWNEAGQSLIPQSEIINLFKQYFVIDKDAQDRARKAIEEGKVLAAKREYPVGYFST